MSGPNSKFTQHILYQCRESKTRWYDNPDVSYLLYTFFNESAELNEHYICLHTWNAAKGVGCHKFKLNANGKVTTEKITSIEEKIIYHPIITVSTTVKKK